MRVKAGLIGCCLILLGVVGWYLFDHFREMKNEVFRLAVYATNMDYRSYYFSLTKEGVLTGSMGKRKGVGAKVDIKRRGFLERTDETASILLSASELQQLEDLADMLAASHYQEPLAGGISWEAKLLHNGIAYRAIYGWEETTEEFTALLEAIIELSPISVEVHGLYAPPVSR